MSARFVKFNRSLKRPSWFFVNVDRVVTFDKDGDKCRLEIDNGSDGDFEFVVGTLDEVAATLSGEPPAPAVKAHPEAIGWLQNPEVPG